MNKKFMNRFISVMVIILCVLLGVVWGLQMSEVIR